MGDRKRPYWIPDDWVPRFDGPGWKPPPVDCPRCGIGRDTDGDGNCAICHHLTDEQVEAYRKGEPDAD